MTSSKIIKTVSKTIGRILLSIFISVWLVVAFLNTTPVQSFFAAKVADYFSKQWHTKVSIGALSVTPFINAGIKDIYIQDLSNDTLLYASYIEANLKSIPQNNHVILRNVTLKDVTCHLTKKNKDFNFQFIIDYFSSNEKQEKKPSKPMTLEVKNINFHNVNFSLFDYDRAYPIEKGLFASNRIVCSDIYLKAKNFKMRGIDMQANILHLAVKERCGIALNEFKGNIKFSPKGIEIHKGVVKTDDSFIDFDAIMQTSDFQTYSSFIDSVYCKLNLHRGSFVDLKEACHWNKKIQGAKQRIYLSCDVQGTISDMIIHQMDIRTSKTHINTNGRITGLTDIKNTFFDLQIGNVTTSIEDYNSLQLGTLVPNIDLPKILYNLGVVNIKGSFKGLINHFSSSVSIFSDLGSADLLAKAQPINDTLTKYIANISSPRIDIGQLIDNPMLENTTLEAQALIVGTNPMTMQGELVASMKNCYFKGNNYNDISLQGEINGYDINAKAEIHDELVNFEGNCFVNYKEKPSINLDATITHLDLYKMNILSFADTSTIIAAKIKGDVKDLDIQHLNCNVTLQDIQIQTSTFNYNLNNINLITTNNDSVNFILLNSDILEANIHGEYTFNSLNSDIKYLLNTYIPNFSSVFSDTTAKKKSNYNTKKSNQSMEQYIVESNVDFMVKVKNIDVVRSLFNLNITIPKQLNIDGKINQDSNLLCNIYAQQISYSDMRFENTKIGLYTQNKQLHLNMNIKEFILSETIAFKNILVNSKVDSTDVDLKVSFAKSDDSTTNVQLELNTIINDKGLQGSFYNTFCNIQGTRVNLNNNHIIGIYNKDISVMNLMLSSSKSSIVVDGMISDDDVLNCKFDNVDLSLANPFIRAMGLNIDGKLNKNVMLKNLLRSPAITSNLEIEGLAINDVYLGKAWLNINNNISSDIFSTDIKFLYQSENKDIVPLQLAGFITPKKENEQLDLNLSMQNFSLSIIRTFISSFASDVDGTLSCDNVKIGGKITAPDIDGKIHCNNIAMKVNMLNTKYRSNDDITVRNNKILFNNFILKDVQDNKITINGNVIHHNFQSFDINLKAVAEKIKILDTKATSGETYYGTAYASANVSLIGDSNQINISGTAKTEAGTYLTVPVNGKESATENDFITFVNLNSITDSSRKNSKNETNNKSMDYSIDIDLNVNPDAKLYIPMDFTQLKGNLVAAGNGDLKITLNSNGKFSMIGEVAIDNGTFGFNIMDIMEKKFILQRGGTLTWNGEPASGILDVSAIYKTKATLSSLLGNEYSKPVDVESIIRLTGEMTNPKPSFDINLPNTDDQTTEQVFMYIDKSNEKVMLEQTASLLLTNQFYFSQGGYETNTLQSGVTSSVMGVAFSQLSGMISNIIKVVDIDLNYISGDNGTKTSDQVDANFSKSYGKWTVELNTSFGGTSQTTTTDEASQIIGDVSVHYKVNDNINIEAFNHSNANDFTKYNISPYTQGARVTYKKEYNKVADVFRKKKKKK